MSADNFGTYDFETYKWTKPLCVGVYFGDNETDFYLNRNNPLDVARTAIEMMLDIADEYDVKQWWAHNGGKFDALLIIEALKSMPDCEAEGIVAGGRIISLRITEHTSGVVIDLKDSYAVIQSNLAKALESFEIPHKKHFTKEFYASLETDSMGMCKLSDDELERGCLDDCRALHALLTKVSGMFVDWGGKLKGTFSSSALSVVKSEVDIPRHDGEQWANLSCRQAYFGGRVEVFNHAPSFKLREYDVTSSYPWSMAQDLPWELVGREDDGYNANPKFLSICYATVNVPAMHIPPLPFSPPTGGLFFPVGNWAGWFTQAELCYARDCGVKVTVHNSVCYTRAKPFSAYINKLFADKALATGARREFDKLCLNGSYGKLAEKPEKEILKIFASSEDGICYVRESNDPTQCTPLVDNDYSVISEKRFQWPSHTHYAAASFITAYSRILLHRHLCAADYPVYCDTDSIHCQFGKCLDTHVNEDLGGLKVELDSYKGRYYAPKLYELHPDKGEPVYASKGFPVNPEAFRQIVTGNKVGKRRMQLVKTQLRKQSAPMMIEAIDNMKDWAGNSAKRRVISDCETTPWDVEDLIEGRHLDSRSPLAPPSKPKRKKR